MLRIEVTPGEYLIGCERGYARARPRTRKRNGESRVELVEYRWFSSIEGALRDFLDDGVRLSEARTLIEAREAADRTLARLCQAFAPEFEIRPRAGPPKQKGPRTGDTAAGRERDKNKAQFRKRVKNGTSEAA